MGTISDTAVVENSNTMESGFEDDFAPMQSSNGVVAEDSSFILGQDEPEVPEESPKKDSEVGDGGDDPNSTASSDLSLSVSKQTEPREDPEVIKLWKENQSGTFEKKSRIITSTSGSFCLLSYIVLLELRITVQMG